MITYLKLYLLIFLLLSCSANSPKLSNYKNIQYDPIENYIPQISRNVYIDPLFNDQEKLEIKEAINEINYVTQHIIDFKISYEITLDEVIIYKVTSDHYIIYNFETKYLNTDNDRLTGFYDDQDGIFKVLLVTDRLEINDYKKVTMHELLHHLRLNHLDEPNTLMYKYSNVSDINCLTTLDMAQFCDVYDCNYRYFKSCD